MPWQLVNRLLERTGRQFEGLAAPRNVRHLLPQHQPVQLLAGEGERTQAIGQVAGPDAMRQRKERIRHLLRLGKAVGGGFGPDVPDNHQEFAAQTRFQPFKFPFPLGMAGAGMPGGFRDAASGVSFATVMDAGSQPGITNQLVTLRKARDVAHGRQDDQGIEHSESGQLHQQGHTFSLHRNFPQLHFQQLNLALREVQGGQVGEQDALFGRGKVTCSHQVRFLAAKIWPSGGTR
jgi:hypothetical protein